MHSSDRTMKGVSRGQCEKAPSGLHSLRLGLERFIRTRLECRVHRCERTGVYGFLLLQVQLE